jgi:hypothetical protein
MDDPKLIITCIPTLVSTLWNREQKKGSPLTEQEVIDICNNAPAIALPANVATKVEAKRGYKDMPGLNVWGEWQKARSDLI